AAESRLDAFAGLDFIELTPEQFIEKYPNNVMVLDTLRYALYCVHKAYNRESLITYCVNFSGDVDSTLSVAMMLFELMKG
ncbi:ADP-ribosylglycohydrolase family protein, partial [Oryzomonas sagensis]|uniref:ADP-ribosylglycohydrolase family protein n=1 Tax=Oryzomonas sagensis TaxID=2603857 RepID=UPI001786F448